MFPVPLTDKTRSFGPPSDWSEDNGSCDTLDICDVEYPSGNFMVSAWKPTKEELNTLIDGGHVFLHIRGVTHPVVSLTTG